MTHSTTLEPTTTDHEAVRKAVLPVGALAFAVSSFWTVVGAHDLTEIVICLGLAAAVTVGVYGFLIPRKLGQESAGGTALTLSIIGAVLYLPAFWSGLPLVLGAAGVLLGMAGRNAATGAGKSIAAIVVGVLASVAYLAIYVYDTTQGHYF